MRLRRAFVLVLTAATAALPAVAHDHRVPRTMLRFEGRALQPGSQGTSTWVTHADERYYVVQHSDSSWEFPEPVSVIAGRTAAIRLRKAARPLVARLDAWVSEGSDRYLVGPTEIRFDLVRAGSRAWDIRFDTGLACRHSYLTLDAAWMDEQGTGQRQDATWLFHYVTDIAASGRRVACAT
jgi:hypothetical protein